MNRENLSNHDKQELVLGIHDDDATEAFKAWTREQAEATAANMNLKLTDEHWKVIDFLRLHFSNTGPLKHARDLTEVLNERFVDEGGSRYLYELFPEGPVNQGCRIAGVPAPADTQNLSMGSVQ
jgi:tRNA 2-thiouridine synthesizing protein E